MVLKYPLKVLVYETLKQRKVITDQDLLNEINKNGGNIQMRELNKALLHLEIIGLINVKWVGKDKRRIEIVEKTQS
ncbi:MAG: hypothetical protein RMJ31_02660 [Nitrososphaerota archaeon]|nr:hypothetical protein [Nitrososphaerales archaeon]MDW8044659.1 hypothetical protein [Nitrososphaerota archaeon]